MNQKQKKITTIVLSAVLVVLEAIAFIRIGESKDPMAASGADTFRFFTNDSNILLALSSLILLIYEAISLKNNNKLPHWVYVLFQAANVGTTLTFLTVFLVLLPTMGVGIITGFNMIVLHIVCPLTGLAVLFFFMGNADFNWKKESYYGMIPMLIYGVVILILVGVNKIEAPYPFLQIHDQPVWASVLYILGMFIGTYLISFLLMFFQKKCQGLIKERR